MAVQKQYTLQWFSCRLKRVVLKAMGKTVMGSVTRVKTMKKMVSLTFDDGPDIFWTPRVLDLLGKYQAKGTFFVTGKSVEKNPKIMNRIISEEHAFGNHTFSHCSLPLLSRKERITEILRCEALLSSYNQKPRLLRPPYCEQNLASRFDLMRLGYQVIMASLTANDWENRDADFMIEQLNAGMKPGEIILLHDKLFGKALGNRQEMIQALELFLEQWQDTYRFVTIPELLRAGRPQKEIWIRKPARNRSACYGVPLENPGK